jgi:hypothetical protein
MLLILERQNNMKQKCRIFKMKMRKTFSENVKKVGKLYRKCDFRKSWLTGLSAEVHWILADWEAQPNAS